MSSQKNHKNLGRTPEKRNKNRAEGKPSGLRPALYGFHAVREAWLNPAREIEVLYLTPQAARGFEKPLQDTARRKDLPRPAPTNIDKTALEKLLPKGAVHQGIALAARPLPESDVQDFIIAAQTRPRTVLVLLDQVTDPHNVGAILRSAAAFGLHGLILQKKHAPEPDGVLAKTACGAVEHLRIAQETNLSRALESLKDAGFTVIGLDERGAETLNAYTGHGIPDKTVLVLGSEGEGIRRLIQENCDILLRLPTSGAIASLNVSNAAAIAFYALHKG